MSSTSNSFDLPASDAGSDAKKAREFKVIALIAVAHFVSHVHIMLLPPLFGEVREAFGVSYIQIGLALTAFNVASALLQTPAGFLVDRIGPRVMLTGGLLLGAAAIADGRDEVLRRAREQLMRGASQIKIMAGGGVASPYDPLDAAQYLEEEMKAAVQAAADWGTYVCAHVYTSQGIQRAIRAGVKSIEHGQLADSATIRMMRDEGVWWSIQPFLADEDANQYTDPASIAKQQQVASGTERAFREGRSLGVKMAFGTDILFSAALAERLWSISSVRGFVAVNYFVPAEAMERLADDPSAVVRGLVQSKDELALGIDTDWREHYKPRTQHPPHDGEKVITRGGKVERVYRTIPYDEATGEFIGIAKFGADGGRRFRDFYARRKAEFWDKPYREAAIFQKAYLIHMFQDMIEQGVEFGLAEPRRQPRRVVEGRLQAWG